MRSPNPPKLATWLLELFTYGSNEEIAGDLIEEFKRRGSSSWYWRQVWAAILVRFTKQMRAQWFSVLFATAWLGTVFAAWGPIHRNSEYHTLFRWTVSQNWPESFMYQMGLECAMSVLAMWLGQTLYVAIWRSFDVRKFTRGLVIGFLGTILLFPIEITVPLIIAPYRSPVRPLLFALTFGALWVFVLLLSIWAAVPGVPRKRVSAV